MLPGVYSTAVQVEMNYHEPLCENLEDAAQKNGAVVIFPRLRDRITLQVGQMLISIGNKLKASSTKNTSALSNKMA
jgi:hypothetical protein